MLKVAIWIVSMSAVSLLTVARLHAQDSPPSTLRRAVTAAALDPTTYSAAALYGDAAMRDWKSSQPLLRAGFIEQNRRFTVSGRSGDKPVSYEAGRNQIAADALKILAVSAVHNVTERLVERSLRDRYPEHRRAIAVVGWIERIGVSALTSYYVAAPHYRQWQQNRRTMAQLGIQ